MAVYLASLLKGQQAAFPVLPAERPIRLCAARTLWPSAAAPTLGMIAVELVTNALKYGDGPIDVDLRLVGGETVLRVADAGTALPMDFEPAGSRGFGMRIVSGLLASHGGRLEVDRSRDAYVLCGER